MDGKVNNQFEPFFPLDFSISLYMAVHRHHNHSIVLYISKASPLSSYTLSPRYCQLGNKILSNILIDMVVTDSIITTSNNHTKNPSPFPYYFFSFELRFIFIFAISVMCPVFFLSFYLPCFYKLSL